jgi:transaldolase
MPERLVRLRKPLSVWIAGSVEQVIEAGRGGQIDAVVTNPTVAAEWCREGETLRAAAMRVVDATGLPLFVQLRGPGRDEMLNEAERLESWSPLILPKLPATPAGLETAARLSQERRDTLITTICTATQAALFAAAGATYLCPYMSRLEEAGSDPLRLIREITRRFDETRAETAIVPASLRRVEQIEQAWLAGAQGVILPFELFRAALDHPLTESSLAGFERDDWPRIDLG